MKQKIKISILPFSVVLMVVIMMAGADTSHAIDFKLYPVVGAYLLGRDFPVTDKFEISVAAIYEYTPGCNWSWSSIGSTLEARYFYYKGFNVGGTALLAYPLNLKRNGSGYSDSKHLELAFNIHPLSYMCHCLFWNHLDLALYFPPGIRLSKFYGGVAGEQYDWKWHFILIGAGVKIYR